MKVIYTGIRNPLTPILVKEAQEQVALGKRVFYIAPNSLSFEKERAVLETLPQHASFDITVTRFGQMARYLVLDELGLEEEQVDDVGLALLLYKVLASFEDKELAVFDHLRKDQAFIQSLAQLYREFRQAHMTVDQLGLLEGERKFEDIQKIFTALEKELHHGNQQLGGGLEKLVSLLQRNQELDLSSIALVIDGYTRFSAEELDLIQLLHNRGVEIIIGVYASKEAYESSFLDGSIYQLSVQFIRSLEEQFQVTAHYLSARHEGIFATLSQKLEDQYAFRDHGSMPLPKDQDQLQIWSLGNQKEELEWVAADIRRKLDQGVRYKDIRVLLGDVDAYRLQLATIFNQYQIPFYLGKAESMAYHPLVQWMDSLERLKRYNFRAEDLLQLLKTGLYTSLTREQVDQFEQYVRFADIKGLAAFSRPFKANREDRFDLEELNRLRQTIMEPLLAFFKAKSQLLPSLLSKWTTFMEDSHLAANMTKLTEGLEADQLDRFEQVWKAYSHILEVMAQLFAKEKLAPADFLALIHAAMQTSSYRTVPATVDVVLVQSYDLVEPMASSYVYAIGMNQANFPKTVKNTTFLSDLDREYLNQNSDSLSQLPLLEGESLMRNHYTALSVFNAAEKQLILTFPQRLNDGESQVSSYLKLVSDMGVSIQNLGQNKEEAVGNYYSLLSLLVEEEQEAIQEAWTKEEATFWSAALRVLKKKLEAGGLQLPEIWQGPTSQALSAESLALLFPAGEPLYLSASKLKTFYQNQYLYFLQNILRLEEPLSIHPDARTHGSYLHEIFEYYLKEQDGDMETAILKTNQDPIFEQIYGEDQEARFTQLQLMEIAQAMTPVLKNPELYQTVEEEAAFGQADQPDFYLADGRPVVIRGFIDRVDQLTANGSLGVVDYKSSDQSFNLRDFYYGLNSQLPTYLEALRKGGQEAVFGAMYLHMKKPLLKIDELKSDSILQDALKQLSYKGLFEADAAKSLKPSKNTSFSSQEMELILAYNRYLYEKTAQAIVTGHFAINPFTKDQKAVDSYSNDHTAITGFEANVHMNQARFLDSLGISGRSNDFKPTWLEQMKGDLDGGADKDHEGI